MPYVLIDRRFADANASYVGADDEAIGRLATRHLIERGCRRIAHIAGPPLTPGVGRLKGYQDALAAAGIVVPDSYIVHATDDASGYLAARRLLALDPRPDAIFGYNDPTAAGAMKAILEAGIAIPQRNQSHRRRQRPLLRPPARAALHHRPEQHRDRPAGRRHADQIHRLQAQTPRQDRPDRPHPGPSRIHAR